MSRTGLRPGGGAGGAVLAGLAGSAALIAVVTIAARLAAFEPRYNATATPFDWRFTRDDLHDMLARLNAHRPADPGPAPLAA